MPTLYRCIIGSIHVAIFVVGAFVIGGTAANSALGVFALQTCALVLVGLPAAVAGLVSSVWTWRGELAQRHRRRLILGTAAVSTIAATTLVTIAALTGDAPVVVLALVAIAAFPGSVALGHAARDAEARRGPVADRLPADLAPALRRAHRNAWIGVAVGIVVAAVLAVWLLTTDPGAGMPITTASLALSLGILVAIAPRTVDSIRMSGTIRATLGSDYADARRIGRAIAGKETLEPSQLDRATRYARMVRITNSFGMTTALLTLTAVALQQVGPLLQHGLDPLRVGTLGSFVVAVAVAVPLQRRASRRLREFIAAHPDRPRI